MATNYYLHDGRVCKCCFREYETLHIGKSSYGWCFSLHVMWDRDIHTLDDWRERWNKEGAYILDEYGRKVSTQEMEKIITDQVGDPLRHTDSRCVGHGEGPWDYIEGYFS